MADLTELRTAAAHVFVDDLAAPDIDDRDVHHLARVLRLRAGERVTASDGQGSWIPGVWTGAGIEPHGDPMAVAAPAVKITIGFAVPKGDRADLAVQKLTEIGVDRIVPLDAERSVVRWRDRVDKHIDRWRAISREAAMQSRRVWLPEVMSPLTPAQAVASLGPVTLAEPGGEPVSLAFPTVLVGPEGGWTAAELDGRRSVELGATVLRTETAAIVAATLLNALRGGNVREAER